MHSTCWICGGVSFAAHAGWTAAMVERIAAGEFRFADDPVGARP